MQFDKLLCTHLVKTWIFYNMLLAAKYAPRKNLEKTHIRNLACKIDAKNVRLGSQTVEKVYV